MRNLIFKTNDVRIVLIDIFIYKIIKKQKTSKWEI